MPDWTTLPKLVLFDGEDYLVVERKARLITTGEQESAERTLYRGPERRRAVAVSSERAVAGAESNLRGRLHFSRDQFPPGHPALGSVWDPEKS